MAVQDPGRTTGFSCKQCGIACPSMPSLLEHMDAHLQQEEERRFKCDECGRGYRHAGSLANHKKTHEVGSFQCNVCGKENSNALALKSHLRSHTSQKKYSCVQCGKSFRLATQLATHERVHLTRRVKEQTYRKVDAEYPADEIENDLPHLLSEQPLSVGMSAENSPVEDMSDVYNAQSETPDDAANRPFRCDLCDKSYIHHRSLTNHKKTHQVGMFECNVCFKLFNNMAALYSHQRTHKARGNTGTESGSMAGAYAGPPHLDQFSPQSQEPEHFCHLCQVRFPNDEEFQDHIQMHNSSSLSFGLQDTLSENHNISYENSIASPESNFYSSPINNIPSVSSVDNYGSFETPQEQIRSNGHVYSDCSNNQTSSSSSTQGELPIMDTGILTPALTHTHNMDNAAEMDETSTVDSDERPFKCQICGKSYRHSGSLINHKRSHQVGIYQCSICRKSYPHLAALKSHLRLHKAQPSSFSLIAEGDWLSSEPLTLESQPVCFPSQEDEDEEELDAAGPGLGLDRENGAEHGNGALYHFDQDFSQDLTAHLPHDEHLMQRHMCADCGEMFADIAGIKSHSCPLLQQHQQQQDASGGDFDNSFQVTNGHCAIGNSGPDADYHGLNGTYFQPGFHDGLSGDQMDNGGGGEEEGDELDDEEEDDDGDLYQCSICGNSYTSMRALRSHLRGHTQSHGTPASSGPSSMSSHEEAKDDDPGEMMICSTCGESFANRQDLIGHQLLHNTEQVDSINQLEMSSSDVSGAKEEPQSIICGSCGIFCTSFHHLQNHGCSAQAKDEATQAGAEVEVEVEDAPQRREVRRRYLREPADAEHRQYKCDQCGRAYRHAGSLLNHKKSHKTGVFRCLVCQKRFYNLLALKNHQRSHFDIKRHTCHECGKAFKIQKQLLNHLRRHKENKAKIQELNNQIQALMQMNGTRAEGGMQPLTSSAGQALTSPRRCKPTPEETMEEITKAEVKTEDGGEQRPFACDQCGRTYRHAGSLVNHRNSHKTGEYCCSVCNNTYSNQLAMKNHLRTHFAFKKHSCQNCGKGFRGKKQLLAHVCADLRRDMSVARRGLKSRTLKCKECKQAFASADQLAAHACERPAPGRDAPRSKNPKKEERPFTCNICNRSYRHAGSLLNHKNTHKTGHFSCSFCSKPFTNPMALRNHTRIHTQKKKYVCLTCGKAFRLASILHNHQKVHSRASGHFSCQMCDKSFQGRSGLKRHRCRRGQENAVRPGVQQAERGDKCFMCDLCGRSYRHAGSLLNHKKTHSENLHHCTLCLQTFPDPLSLQIHSQMRRHCCPECGKTFCLLAHLQSHMEVHGTKERPAASYHAAATDPYQQEALDDGLCWDSGIDPTIGMDDLHKPVPPPLSHIPESVANSQSEGGGGGDPAAGAEEKSHVCEHCGRTYRHAGSLLNHKNSHKTGSFFCSVCQKEFTNLMALKNHRRIHTEPKRYQCLECGKAFRVSTQLICHRRIHTKEKPFACLLCDKSFSSKSNLRHHQKMHQSAQSYDSSFSMDDNTFMDLDMGSFL